MTTPANVSRPLVGLAVATVFGVGYVPVRAGHVRFGRRPAPLVAAAGVAASCRPSPSSRIFVAGSWSGSVAERHFGRTDPGQVVIDEVMGMLITLFLNPVGWPGALAGFLLFRVADVIKPYPANRLERLHGGIGVMADDAMAAVYANLALRAALWHWVIG